MPAVPITLLVGPEFRLLSRAELEGDTVRGQMDFPPPHQDWYWGHHYAPPGKLLLPAVGAISLMHQAVHLLGVAMSESRLAPVLIDMPMVEIHSLTKPAEVIVEARVFRSAASWTASASISANGKERASASFNFRLREAVPDPPLPLPLEEVTISPTGTGKSLRAVFHYQGNERIPLTGHQVVPWPLVLEALGQNMEQVRNGDPSLEKALFFVTYLKGTTFHQPAPPGTIDLLTQIEWTDERHGLVHAAASCGGLPVVDGDFGLAIANRKRP